MKNQSRILLIEDDRFLRELYGQSLENAGYTVLAAFEGQMALDLLDEYGAELILLDLMLPGHSGIELLNELQSHSDWQKLPVVVLSAVGQNRFKGDLGQFGVVDYLQKGEFTPKELPSLIKRHL